MAANKRDVNGLVYFVQRESGPIKIGFTTRKIEVRARIIETACGEKVKILGTLPGPQSLETRVHRMFSHLRLIGEWFRSGEELLRFINNPQFDIETSKKKITPRVIGKRSPTILGLTARDQPEQARAQLEPVILAHTGNVAATARDLGVSVETLWRWIRTLELGDVVARARVG